MFDFLREKFEIRLKVWHNIPLEAQDESVSNISPVLMNIDPLALNTVYQVSQASKSAALGLALAYLDGSND